MKKYCVYIHTNRINNKRYIGQTCQDPKRRFGKNGNGYKACPHFYKAIQKYGWDSFDHEVIRKELTEEEANILEFELIKKYNTTNKDYGYNTHTGGKYGGHLPKRDLPQKQYGYWTVIGRDEGRDGDQWICQCRCGKIKSVYGYNLLSGNSISCGCEQRRIASSLQYSHGMSNTRLHRIWLGMRGKLAEKWNRTHKSQIKICQEWSDDFMTFFNWSIKNGYDETKHLDRIDLHEDWSPINCRWITEKEKLAHRSDAVLYTYKNKTLNLEDWSKETGIKRLTLWSRINNLGMTIGEAIETPTKGEGSPLYKRAKKYEYKGIEHTIREWSEIYNINYQSLRNRITRDKWTMQKAIDFYLQKEVKSS